MKKLKLNLQNIEGVEILSREQLKMVMGGSGGGSGGSGGGSSCECDGSVGAWTYSGTVSCQTWIDDINTYCRSGEGTCTGGCGGG